ncbi:MAG TPA: hypothetical protein VGN26_14415 [Armatimonadota bacterium]|jgi:hypothetical protein
MEEGAAAALAAYREARLYLGRAQGGAVGTGPAMAWCYTGSEAMSCAFPLTSDGGAVEEESRQLLHHLIFASAEAEWLFADGAGFDAPLARLLALPSFRSGSALELLAADLVKLPQAPPEPPGLLLQDVDYCDAVKRWLRLVPPSHRGLFTKLGFSQDLPSRRYVAVLQGVPVAASLVHLRGGTATLQWLKAPADAQGRGVTLALLHLMLREARRHECRTLVAAVEEPLAGLFQRLGLERQGRLARLLWAPGS